MKNILSIQNKISPEDFAPLDENYFKEESLDTEEIGYWKASWIRLKSNKIAIAALVVIVIMFIFAFIGPLLSPYSYDQQVRGDEALWPCLKHPFGTDRLGRDILVRCMIGTRISMVVGLVSAVIVMIVGSIYGAISGLVGGKVDIVMMRIVDIIYSVPEILLIVVIGGIGSVTGSCISSFLFITCSEWILRFLDNDTYIGDFHVPLLRSGFRKVVFSIIIMIIVLFFRQGIMGTKEFSVAGIRNFFVRKSNKEKGRKLQ